MNVREALDWLTFCAENDCDHCPNSEKPIEWCEDKMAECVQRVKMALDTPSDIRKVVLCKDCKHYERYDGIALMQCSLNPLIVNDNDFCSYGERREP